MARGAKLRKWTKIFDFFFWVPLRVGKFAKISHGFMSVWCAQERPRGESGCGESAAVVSAYAAAANTPLLPTHRALLKRKREVSW